jgi:WD40 repeat protein
VAIGEQVLLVELAPDGKPARTAKLPGTRGEVLDVAFGPTGDVIAAVDESGKLSLWNALTGTPQWNRQAHDGEAQAVAFTMDGRYVLTGGEKGDVRAWTVGGEPFAELTRNGGRHPGEVRAVLPHGPGRGAFTVDDRGQLLLWDVDTQRRVRPTYMDMEVRSEATDCSNVIILVRMRGGPAQRRGGVLACAGKHLWALIFLVLFASRQKVQKR